MHDTTVGQGLDQFVGQSGFTTICDTAKKRKDTVGPSTYIPGRYQMIPQDQMSALMEIIISLIHLKA